jgi:hypothetical protein
MDALAQCCQKQLPVEAQPDANTGAALAADIRVAQAWYM